MKNTLKKLIPSPIWNIARDTVITARHLPELPAAYLHPWRKESMESLAEFKDKYKGERCFIIGNGPSLRDTDVSKLKNEYTFGMNRIYLAFEEWGFQTTFLASVNDLVIEQCVDDFLALDMPRFFSWRSRKHFKSATSNLPTFLYTTYDGMKFAQDISRRVWEGATVTNICLQLAYHMGFETAILIGVDHSFKSKGEANKTVTSDGDDLNHFDPRYFGKGFRWQLPDLDMSEIAYLMARNAYEQDKRQILDATIGGKLTVFDKVDYESLF
ncbi:MAG: DUF115 domain-containing protein [Anaerolineae bacterium]|jgi:hypothetical protein|nr:DUF115 domain-containing protein [Anaerolineae bacterium]MBT7074119.1 DUF115 domain-containing protein [Anaerolineae bacterium]MBT7781352.1 DUF115 domain-containing protein [Anaerolineae bacterium]